MSRQRSHVTSQATGSPGLALHEAAARAQELLRERARLLRDIQKKKQQLEQVRQQTARDAQQAVAQMAPLLERHRKLIAELSALFTELLAAGRLPARARKELLRLRRSLELQGVLSPPYDEDEDEESAFDGEPGGSREGGQRGASRGEGAPAGAGARTRPGAASAEPEVAGAGQVGQKRRSLRELFRNLARAVHPDRARHDAEREHRTEVMKQVTRAYEEGDLARLVELESAWQSEQALAGTGDPQQRVKELERINRELLDQVRRLTKELRDAKRDAREESMGLPPEELVQQASHELDQLEAVCDLVRRFRDGKASLSELMRGPRPVDIGEEELALLERLLFDDLDGVDRPARRRRPRRR